jgi:hypothetical protein
MSERESIRHAADMLAGYAATCRMTNQLAWMEGLAQRINEYLEVCGDGERVVTSGYGLETVSAAEMCDRILKRMKE